MANEAEVKILTIDAVQNMADLRKAIHDTKEELAKYELGTEDYQRVLGDLIKEQNLMRGALNGTTASMDDLKKSAAGATDSYNGLVNKMADLTRQFRTTKDAAERADLGAQIKQINDQLKEMDAMRGNFQRNVGDYFNQTSAALKSVIKDLPSALDKVKGPLRDIEGTMGLMSTHPILGIIGLLAPLLAQIVKDLKEDETAMAGIKKIMDAMKPVMDFFSGILQNVVEYVGDLITQAANFLGSSGIFQKIVQGVMGVGNAILQFVIAPFKAVSAAIKVFKEQGVKGIGDAARAMNDEFNKGIAFKQNFQSGQAVADAIVAGAKSRKPGKEVAKNIKKDLEDELLKADDLEKIWEKALNKMLAKMREQKAFENEVQAILDEQQDLIDAEVEQYIAALEDEAKAEQIVRETEVKMAKEAAQQKLDSMQTYAAGTSGLLNGIADMLEEEGKSAKNLRIAAATIDMISGAVTAFSTAQQLGPIAGPIVGAINAAAVVASGLANIAKIRATNVSKDAAPTSTAPTATVSAPALETAVPATTVINGARTETALNRAAQPSRVYVVQSDIEAAAQDTRVQVAEASF